MTDDNDWVRKFLVRLKKLQVCEALDRLNNDNRSHISLMVGGISERQIELTRSWVMNDVLAVLGAAVEKPPVAEEKINVVLNQEQTEWKVAEGPAPEASGD